MYCLLLFSPAGKCCRLLVSDGEGDISQRISLRFIHRLTSFVFIAIWFLFTPDNLTGETRLVANNPTILGCIILRMT